MQRIIIYIILSALFSSNLFGQGIFKRKKVEECDKFYPTRTNDELRTQVEISLQKIYVMKQDGDISDKDFNLIKIGYYELKRDMNNFYQRVTNDIASSRTGWKQKGVFCRKYPEDLQSLTTKAEKFYEKLDNIVEIDSGILEASFGSLLGDIIGYLKDIVDKIITDPNPQKTADNLYKQIKWKEIKDILGIFNK